MIILFGLIEFSNDYENDQKRAKKESSIQYAIEKVELMLECCPLQLRIGKAIMKLKKKVELHKRLYVELSILGLLFIYRLKP